ncbi:MAG: ribosome recycling factor [Phycisphaerales bacterium]|nr:ribosome recycling factor [Phycisphaerales bacterium]
MAVDKIVRESEHTMSSAVDFLKQSLRGVRTGRASTGLLDGLKVEVASYGSTMGIKELANVAVAEGNVLVIKAFDPSTLKDIERAIEKSDLGINPQNDGKVIRLPVPPLSTERRNQLVSHVKDVAEQQKVAIRNVRRDANKAIEAAKKEKTITEDDADRAEKQTQDLTNKYTKQVDDLVEEKRKEIMD